MAKGKNEILLSIALEGDADIKAKLKAVGEVGKQSLADIEKRIGSAGEGAGKRFAGALDGASLGKKLSEALAPLTEATGIGGLLGSLGAGGLFGRLAAGLTSPAGLVAGVTGALLGMAKLGEETDKAKLKLKALGTSGDTFEKLKKTANELGVSTESLQPSFEKFAASKNKINADRTSGVIRLRPNGATAADEAAAGVRIIGGGKETGAAVPDKVFIGALKTLIEGAQAEKIPGDQAGQIADAFNSKVQEDRKLTPEAVDTLNPVSQNILAKSLSSFFGRDLLNGAELKDQLARPGQRAPSDNEVFRSLNAAEPEAKKQAEAAYGLTAAFDALLASTKHLAEAFSGDVGIADAINKLVKLINDASDNADKIIHPRNYEPGGPKFIGPASPEERQEYNKPDVLDLGKTLLTGESDPRFKDSNAVKATKFLRDGPQLLQQTPGEAVDAIKANPIVDFFGKAFTSPGLLQEKARPTEPVPVQPVAPQQQSSIEGDKSKSIAGTVDALDGSLKQLASAVYDAVSKMGNTPQERIAALASGGSIRRFPGGGGVSGPGSTTSDSIPAMLSDKEYVIKAESARKIGRGPLDWLNAGNFADGGLLDNDEARRRAAASPWRRWFQGFGGTEAGAPLRTTASADKSPGAGDFKGSSFVGDFDWQKWQLYATDYYKADGGPIGNLAAFGNGGMVSFPGFAIGGPALMGEAPSLADLGGAGVAESLHPVTINFEGRPVAGLRAPGDVVDSLRKEARDSANFQTGQAPSWAHGS